MPHQFFSLLSGILFLVLYYLYDLFTASLVLSAASAIQMCALSLRNIHTSQMEWINLSVMTGFGFMSWWFHNEKYVQWKLTIVNLALAFGILVYHTWWQKSVTQLVLARQKLYLEQPLAKRIDRYFMLFFTAIAATNAAIVRYYSVSTWVLFKSSLIVVNAIFFIFIAMFVAQNIKEHPVTQ